MAPDGVGLGDALAGSGGRSMRLRRPLEPGAATTSAGVGDRTRRLRRLL
jgi:hypothetical protein